MLKKHRDLFLALIPVFVLLVLFASIFFKLNLFKSSPEVIGENTNAKQISTNYYDYSATNFKKAAGSGKVVLFFATNWCSTCTELDNELMNESEKLKDGITVLRLDYDRSTEFKRKYNVTVQHTLVQVDNDGKEITKWIGGDIDVINKSVKL